MTTISEAVGAAVAAQLPPLSNRVYFVALPLNVTLPAARYQRISTVRISSNSGPSHLARTRIQIDLVGPTYSALSALAATLRTALMDFSGSLSDLRIDRIAFDDDRDDYDPQTKRYMLQMDLIIWHEEV